MLQELHGICNKYLVEMHGSRKREVCVRDMDISCDNTNFKNVGLRQRLTESQGLSNKPYDESSLVKLPHSFDA